MPSTIVRNAARPMRPRLIAAGSGVTPALPPGIPRAGRDATTVPRKHVRQLRDSTDAGRWSAAPARTGLSAKRAVTSVMSRPLVSVGLHQVLTAAPHGFGPRPYHRQ